MRNWIIAILSPFCCAFTCASYEGARVFSTDDLGIVATSSRSNAAGGPTALIAGQSGSAREVAYAEAQKPGRIQVGDITIEGVVSSSQPAAERWHGLGMLARTAAMYGSIKEMFSFAKFREGADVDKVGIKEAGKTDRASIEASNATERAAIEAATIE